MIAASIKRPQAYLLLSFGLWSEKGVDVGFIK